MQLDLEGFEIPYTCKKCGRCFATMQQSSRHHARFHKNKYRKYTLINFTLENYSLVSTQEIQIEMSN
ncbi:MAG: hypothetical protein COA77_02485 [Thaumarchaeota archaeon]|nr:MAG: hypothetical protein COA77_02485 [Nitrososphaerota archaeon]